MGNSINSWSADYVDAAYEQWRRDPESVDEKWRLFFQGFDLGMARSEGGAAPAAPGRAEGPPRKPEGAADAQWSDYTHRLEILQSRVDSLIYHYRDVGHLIASLDPLGRNRTSHPLLELDNFGLQGDLLDMVFNADRLYHGPEDMSLRDIIGVLRATYCRSIGVEYMHIQNTPERRWLQQRMEGSLNKPEPPAGKKLRIARMLRKALAFESFLQSNYLGQKRFSLEGGETLIPLLDTVIEKCPLVGVSDIVIGMAHRGRLNVLANIMQKSYEEIFGEFEDNYQPGVIMGDGDVKYHKGYSTDWTTFHGQTVHLSLTANPSHLEAVDPVVLGRVRARQRRIGDTDRSRVMGLLIHGDAAFPGQGIVAETLNLSQLQGYRTGGTIHIIVNNQIGFTTLPGDSRSGTYCTEVAKSIQAPIFHVNGDDAEAVLQVAEIAVEYRQQFKKDVVIDMYCFRRHGHNEGDEPSFTQPRLYEQIKAHPGTYQIYAKELVEEGSVTREALDQMERELDKSLSDAQERAKTTKIAPKRAFEKEWGSLTPHYSHEPVDTSVSPEAVRRVSTVWENFPEGFTPHPKLKKLYEKRLETLMNEEPIDWAIGESLAFGTLLLEGTPVRLSGQDSRRGTFSHRHACVWDINNGEPHVPLNHIAPDQARFCVYDSPLSEAAVLGFDYGYSLDEPDMLICWEAQFGDFANGAQTIIDQFLASSESKWQRASGLVMLLPHGYEGQGPEHSSARLERFLQLCADDNIQVANVTTPAQIFHLLRRQVRRNFRKPLVIMTPKSLLRHPRAVSDISEFTSGHFQEVLDDSIPHAAVTRLVLCSGKVYYDLIAHREKEGIAETAVIRMEQFHPYPRTQLRAVLERYPSAREVFWCQEEPQNMGGWSFVAPRLAEDTKLAVRYVGRPAASSPAVGSLKRHNAEQKALVTSAFARTEPARAHAGAAADSAN